MTEDTTTDEVQADGGPDDIRARAVHLTSNLATMAHFLVLLEKDPETATEGLEDAELATAVATIQDVRHRLGLLENALTTALGKRLGKTTGNLPDGRQFTLSRAADRKEWDHEEWKRDTRRTIVSHTTEELGSTVNLVTADGEVQELNLAALLHSAITEAQEVHGSTAPRSRALKLLGLYASDYCTSTPSGWRFQALKPSVPTTTTEEPSNG